jgi:uncharacterized protein
LWRFENKSGARAKDREPPTLYAAVSAVGRMALSNYILTSLACQFLFKWGPWKLYDALEFQSPPEVVF